MRKTGQLAKARSSRQLLKALTDNPALPAFVRRLEAPVLKRLIDQVGLHDAGQLIALTTTRQLREIFEESLWESLVPGQAERLRPERFLEWLEVMFDVGPAFAVERLLELGDTFVVLNFAPLIKVSDRSIAAEHEDESCNCVMCRLAARDAPFEVIGDYLVVGMHDDEWETVRNALVELDGEDARFVQRVLARCCNAPTVRGFADDGQPLLDDETYEREQRRERGGFVTPPMAAAFLETARRATGADLAAQVGYDAISQRYFDQLAAAAAQAPSGGGALDDEAPDGAATITAVQLRDLERALVDAEIVSDRAPELLSGPQNAREPTLALQAYLDRLQLTHPQVFSDRLGELIFLANVLMSGSGYQGGRFTETEAARAALACANLGLDQLLATQASLRAQERAQLIERFLDGPPGLVRLFRIGWNLIQAVPRRAARALLDALRAEHVREQLRRKRWILDEIESAVSDPDLLDLIEQGEFADVGDNLVLVGLVLDARACQCLRTLIADFPRYPLQLNVGLQRGQTNESQYLTTVAQLAKVDAFLERIDELLKI